MGGGTALDWVSSWMLPSENAAADSTCGRGIAGPSDAVTPDIKSPPGEPPKLVQRMRYISHRDIGGMDNIKTVLKFE